VPRHQSRRFTGALSLPERESEYSDRLFSAVLVSGHSFRRATRVRLIGGSALFFPRIFLIPQTLDFRNSTRARAISPARKAAFDILLAVVREDAYVSELLHSSRYSSLSPPDHRLATEIAMGVLRWRSRLDEEISAVSAQPLEKLDDEVLEALRIGAYQIGYLDRIPARAAINESVELVKRGPKKSAAPFVNAVLRKLATRALPSAWPGDEPAALSRRCAHPRWLVDRWIAQFGLAVTARICAYDQQPPPTALRLRDAAAEPELLDSGARISPGALLSSARVVESGADTHGPLFRRGRIVIQDEGSQLIAALVGPGSRILDCCCAPGGKTSILADRNPRSPVVAVELHPHRARLTRKLVPQANVRVLTADARNLPLSSKFDRVLVDVPCSGTGTLARNPEIKWRLRPEDLLDLQSRQLAILESAMRHVAAGGRLLYSSCSLEREENADVIERSLAQSKDFDLIDVRPELENLRSAGELTWPDLNSLVDGPYLRTIPGVHPCDGFFAALLERSAGNGK
jgi:16S rRNA (cytosine967-C5)-methyltransferase